MSGVLVIFFLVIAGGLALMGIFSRQYRDERRRLEQALTSGSFLKISGVRTYGFEKRGWRNNFPSSLGWETTDLFVTGDCVLVTGRSKFPFVFRSEMQPFVLASNADAVSARLNFQRVFAPLNLLITSGSDLELTISPPSSLGKLEVRLIFERIGKENGERIAQVLRPNSN